MIGRDLRYSDPFGPYFDGPGYAPARWVKRDDDDEPEPDRDDIEDNLDWIEDTEWFEEAK